MLLSRVIQMLGDVHITSLHIGARAILARGAEPEETRRGLPGDQDDTHRRGIRMRARKGLALSYSAETRWPWAPFWQRRKLPSM